MTAAATEPKTRIEKDSMGEMPVPSDALYGASTARAVDNFPVAHEPVPAAVIHAFGHLKAACAQVNHELGRLNGPRSTAIAKASMEIAQGQHDRHFPVDVYQTGSGTSTNTNVNEVVANLVCLANGRPPGCGRDPAWIGDLADGIGVHPNDHVNLGQSSNDTFPTAVHVAAALLVQGSLLPALGKVAASLESRARQWDQVVKIGRTHLQDATPIRLGQEFSGYAHQMRQAESRARSALRDLQELPIGGTAVGTGLNTHVSFGRLVAARLSDTLGVEFRAAANSFEAQHARDAVVSASGHLKTVAVSLSKIVSDIRLMGSGPRCGLGELRLPALQPGSSIMPGKVNPVVVESAMMVCCRVIGNDATITTAGLGGIGGLLDLHVAMPVMAEALLDSADLLANACVMFEQRCLAGLEVDAERCAELIDRSLALATGLVPALGYDRAAALAKEALGRDMTVRALATEQGLLPRDRLAQLLDPRSMTLPDGAP